ncbi:Vitamin K epoxide reductase [mine drainage metagenome]|uniref:Vitamin K epoxide reductase n=1 Tax=mine drainage metagenome TaxID=410659 RepID=T0ZI08_9ZZZZ
MIVIYEWSILHTPPPFCVLGNTTSTAGITLNCAKVLSSPYSSAFGVSLEALAAVWFIINLILIILVVSARTSVARRSIDVLFAWRFLGLAIVPYLIYLELFVVRAICLYCTIMHGAIIIDFAIITYLVFSKRSSIRNKLG